MKKITFGLLSLFALQTSAQTIPNASFDVWNTPVGTSYQEPDLWSTSNATLSQLGVAANVSEETTTFHSAPSAAKLTTTSLFGGAAIASGALSSGNIVYANQTLTFNGGFHFTSRPGQLTGWFKYAPTGTDSCAVWVLLTKWNAGVRDTIAYGMMWENHPVNDWSQFAVTLNYNNSSDSPDTALIVALSSKRIVAIGGVAGSTLWLDDLLFQFGAGIDNVGSAMPVNVYPNPAQNRLMLDVVPGQYSNASVYDMTGRLVNTLTLQGNAVDVSALNNGQYVVELRNRDGVLRSTFAKQ